MTEQWRVGRRNPHNVYRQHGDEPRGMEHDDHDDSLGYFRHPEDAQRAVDAVNGAAPAVEVVDGATGLPAELAQFLRAVRALLNLPDEWSVRDVLDAARVWIAANVRHEPPAPALAVGDELHDVDDLDRCPAGTWVESADQHHGVVVPHRNAHSGVAWGGQPANRWWPLTVRGVPGGTP